MSWLGIISSLIGLIKLILGEAAKKRQRQVMADGTNLGRMAALKEALDETVDLLSQAEAARRAFRDQLRLRPDSLSDDDGYKRRPRSTIATDGRTE